MPCYTPLYMSRDGDGNYSLSRSKKHESYTRVSCGQCIGCLLRRSRDWAVRCTHHSKISPPNSCWFLTLTYDEHHLPRHPVTGKPTFLPDDLSATLKRLRTNTALSGIKYFACREYGERTLRPHYHVCLFGLPLNDLRHYKRSRDGFDLFNSDTLSKAWQYRGHAVVAPLSFNTVSYTARYTTKKIGSALKPIDRHYATDIITGECFEHLPERTYASNRPGIGHDFFMHHHDQLLGLGSTIIGNKRYPLPRYYLRLAKEMGSDLWAEYDITRSKYYQNAEYFDDSSLLAQMRDKLLIVDRMVRSVV